MWIVRILNLNNNKEFLIDFPKSTDCADFINALRDASKVPFKAFVTYQPK